MPTETPDRTRELCAFLTALEFDAIPASVIERAKDLALDHFGVALHSASLPWTRIVREFARSSDGRAESTIYGDAQKVGRRAAALANGTAAHGIELDDTHNESFSHPGAVVIAAALAVAEALDASGRDLLTAVVAGYEAQCRAGAAANAALSRGFHPTAVAGVFGAAAAAARLMKLDRQQLESAFGVAASTASGVMQFAEDAEGNMVKRLHGGLPAHNGVMAVELAAAGLRGPRKALDGRFGFVQVFAGSTDSSRLTRGLGAAWEIEQISVKLYACCRHFHAFIDALLECRQQTAFRAEDVQAVEVATTAVALDGRMQYRPRSVMAAQYSLPYAVAATILLDPQDPRSFSEEAIARQEMVALMDRVSARADPTLERYLPERFPGGVRVTLNDGQRIECTRLDSVGTPDHPVDRAGIVAKFRALMTGVASAEWQNRIMGAVFSLEKSDGLARLTALLRDVAGFPTSRESAKFGKA